MTKWFEKEFSGLKIVEVDPRGKSNPRNKRQNVGVTCITTRDHKILGWTRKAGTKTSGAMRLSDEQLAEVLAAR